MSKSMMKWTLGLLAVGCMLAMAGPANAGIIDSALSFWSFDDGPGDGTNTTVADSLANARDGTMLNMDPPTDWVAGRRGVAGDWALDFDNANDHVKVYTPHEFNFNEADTFSAGVWINHDGVISAQTTSCIMGTFRTNSPYDGWGITVAGVAGSRKIMFVIKSGSGQIGVEAVDLLAIDEWVHVAVTHDGTDHDGMKIYINGVEAATTVPSWSDLGTVVAAIPRALTFGSYEGSSRDYSGMIDEAAIYGRTLTATEVDDLYSIPEPSVLVLLLGVGLFGLIARARRRR